MQIYYLILYAAFFVSLLSRFGKESSIHGFLFLLIRYFVKTNSATKLPPVFTGDNINRTLEAFLRQHFADEKKFLLVDENTRKHCLPLIKTSIGKASIVSISSGEKHKNIQTLCRVWEKLSVANADRKSLLINLGGGVITDLGGFAASTYKRGIRFINIPTTLLAQVDASVGGKTGIDFMAGKRLMKNQLGVFKNPEAVFIGAAFLKTLDEREFLSGYAEIVKHALIRDRKYWEFLKGFSAESGNTHIGKVISRSIEIKTEVVKKDPEESGLRKILNFGHTVGHAIESYSLLYDKKPLLHGEAIAIGMICEAFLSHRLAGLSQEALYEINGFIRHRYAHYPLKRTHYPALIRLMQGDKKNSGQNILFSLLNSIGSCSYNIACPGELIRSALDFYRTEH